MLDIQALTDEIERVTQSIDWWNKWLIAGMAATAIAGSVLVVAQLMVNKQTRKLSETQDRLSKAKDDQLDKDLREKDVLIATANERAGRLELDAATQRKLTAEANRRAVEAQLALEKFRTPRTLTPDQRKSFVDDMSKFKGQKVFLGTFSSTFEVVAFGQQIFEALKDAGVNVEARPEFVTRVIGAARGVVAGYTTGNDKSKGLAVSLVKVLNDRGIIAGAIDNLDEEIVPKMEREHGEVYARNGEHFAHVAVAIGDKP